MGTINIYNNTGSNKNSLEFNDNIDNSVNTEHLTGTSSIDALTARIEALESNTTP